MQSKYEVQRTPSGGFSILETIGKGEDKVFTSRVSVLVPVVEGETVRVTDDGWHVTATLTGGGVETVLNYPEKLEIT